MNQSNTQTKNKINYQKELDKLLSEIDINNKPSLLMHSCCAPCSSYCLVYLKNYFNITVLFYNPNIYPEEEYYKREEELKRLISELNKEYSCEIKFADCDYESERFYDMSKGMEKLKEGGERCFACYALRLKKTAEVAKEKAFDYFVTTLTISPLKNAEKLNEIGNILAKEYGVKYLPSDFKKKGGYLQSIELSKKYDLYRQNFCGCEYSYLESLSR